MIRSSRGMSLLMVITFSLVFNLMAVAMLEHSTHLRRFEKIQITRLQATELANTGLSLAERWLRQKTFLETYTLNRNPLTLIDAPYGTNGRIKVVITPDAQNVSIPFVLPVGGDYTGYYTITSEGTISSGVSGSIDTYATSSIDIKSTRTTTYSIMSGYSYSYTYGRIANSYRTSYAHPLHP